LFLQTQQWLHDFLMVIGSELCFNNTNELRPCAYFVTRFLCLQPESRIDVENSEVIQAFVPPDPAHSTTRQVPA
jgi:hypothetical protein